jgi:hypothetical protein
MSALQIFKLQGYDCKTAYTSRGVSEVFSCFSNKWRDLIGPL